MEVRRAAKRLWMTYQEIDVLQYCIRLARDSPTYVAAHPSVAGVGLRLHDHAPLH